MDQYAFASDNASGICPEAWEVMAEANARPCSSYGEDPYTVEACDRLREIFETDCEVFFVFNGTAANALSLASLCRSYEAVICHERAHIQTDECGAPEFFGGGIKLLPCKGDHAKLTPTIIEQAFAERRDLHFPRPGALSTTQSTEFGTTYKVDELDVPNTPEITRGGRFRRVS
ncbi:MAG: beta-eliminating lyase-related protein [Verrucomicrobiota bacterium]